jgi:hypothetical protein
MGWIELLPWQERYTYTVDIAYGELGIAIFIFREFDELRDGITKCINAMEER